MGILQFRRLINVINRFFNDYYDIGNVEVGKSGVGSHRNSQDWIMDIGAKCC